MKQSYLVLAAVLFVSFVGTSQVMAAPDQGRDIEVLEHVYFSIKRVPTNRSDGQIVIFKDPAETEGTCLDCELTLRFSADLPIKVGGETSMMTIEQLRLLPQQRVNVEVRDGRMLSIGMTKVERGTLYRKDL